LQIIKKEKPTAGDELCTKSSNPKTLNIPD